MTREQLELLTEDQLKALVDEHSEGSSVYVKSRPGAFAVVMYFTRLVATEITLVVKVSRHINEDWDKEFRRVAWAIPGVEKVDRQYEPADVQWKWYYMTIPSSDPVHVRKGFTVLMDFLYRLEEKNLITRL